jgi:hypothetical protein
LEPLEQETKNGEVRRESAKNKAGIKDTRFFTTSQALSYEVPEIRKTFQGIMRKVSIKEKFGRKVWLPQ